MDRRTAGGLGASLLVLALAGCGSSATVEEPQLTDIGPGHGVAFALYTHCGIDVVMYRGRWFERVGGLLDDGRGNPPASPPPKCS